MRDRPHLRPSSCLGLCILALLLAGLAIYGIWHAVLPEEAPIERVIPVGRTVVFVVIDTLGSDRMSLCGHSRPTSPFFDSLCDRRAICTCDAYAPSTWTLPSHASFFTGLMPPDHGSGVMGSGVRVLSGEEARPLGPERPTLAEKFKQRGYQTALVSANPIVTDWTGLARGFDRQSVAETFGSFFGEGIVSPLTSVLREASSMDAPLFLFVNIADTHQPYSDIPEGHAWLPPRRGLSLNSAPGGARVRYTTGEMSEEERTDFRERFEDLYDYSVSRADETLARVVGLLEDGGWLDGDHLVVITSDHGEMLGSHELLGHKGPYFFEGLARVPFAVFGSDLDLNLPEPMQALHAHRLLLGGKIPEDDTRSVTFSTPEWYRWFGREIGVLPGAAHWLPGGQKMMFADGRCSTVDLVSDPGEHRPEAAQGESCERLRAMVEKAIQAESTSGAEPSPKMTEALRALGYLD